MNLNWIKNNWFKIIAAIVLFGGLGSHPYSYYQLLRWVVSASGLYAFYVSYKTKHNAWAWIYVVIGILFNPIIPFYLQRSTWQNLDLITGAIFIVGSFFDKSPKPSNQK